MIVSMEIHSNVGLTFQCLLSFVVFAINLMVTIILRKSSYCKIETPGWEISGPHSVPLKCYGNVGLSNVGVTLDIHLNLNEHYSKTSKRISTRTKLLKKIRDEIPPTVAEQIYNSIIKPVFLYCSTINLGQSQTWENRFEKLQNQAKSVIGRNASNWPSIKVERMRKLSLEVFKSIHGLVTINRAKYDIIDHSINTRGNKSTIRLPRIRTEARPQDFFLPRSCHIQHATCSCKK